MGRKPKLPSPAPTAVTWATTRVSTVHETSVWKVNCFNHTWNSGPNPEMFQVYMKPTCPRQGGFLLDVENRTNMESDSIFVLFFSLWNSSFRRHSIAKQPWYLEILIPIIKVKFGMPRANLSNYCHLSEANHPFFCSLHWTFFTSFCGVKRTILAVNWNCSLRWQGRITTRRQKS